MSSRALILVGVLCLGPAALAQEPRPPTSQVPDVVRARCVTCHGVDLIQQQRLNRAGWERELDKMTRWGAVVPAAERPALVDGLEMLSRSSVAPASVGTGESARGAELFTQRCLGCHASDIVEQQRLGIAGWRREVAKMVGWGARLDEADREPLAAHLTARFGVR